MTVQQVINLAVDGELKNIAVKKDTSAILGFINLGLIELYKRFSLKVEEHMVALQDGVEIYTMPSDYLWMIAAYGEIPAGSSLTVNELPINEEDNPLSINTVSWNTVQIPITIDGAYISIIYRAAPVYLTINDLDTDIQIPPQMIEAMLSYIGYRGHASVSSKNGTEYGNHYTLFEQACARIEADGMFTSDDLYMKSRIADRGFL